jgi:hypothetical protein
MRCFSFVLSKHKLWRCAMKVYVLLRDGVPLGYCLAAATHGTLIS